MNEVNRFRLSVSTSLLQKMTRVVLVVFSSIGLTEFSLKITEGSL